MADRHGYERITGAPLWDRIRKSEFGRNFYSRCDGAAAAYRGVSGAGTSKIIFPFPHFHAQNWVSLRDSSPQHRSTHRGALGLRGAPSGSAPTHYLRTHAGQDGKECAWQSGQVAHRHKRVSMGHSLGGATREHVSLRREQGNTDLSHAEKRLVQAPRNIAGTYTGYEGLDQKNVEVREQQARKFCESLFEA